MSRKYAATHAYADFDPVVYRAGFASQKTKYIFKNEDGEIVSGLFDSANAAKNWLEEQEEFEDVSGYVRESTVEYMSEDFARKKFDEITEEYKKLAGSQIVSFKGYLTRSGDKHKDIKGIEDRYQLAREGVDKPLHYDMLREYAMSKEFITVCPEGHEADEMLIYLAEKKGDKAVILSIDKDMCTGQNIWMIHIQKDGSGKPVWNTSLGHLELHKKRDKAVGGGFKFLAYQAINGDRSDHYFGCKGVGPVLAVDLIKDCESEQEIIEKCLELYQETYGDLYEYTSWDGQEMKKTPIEMLQMHFEMPWMRDTPKGKPFDIYDYL